MNATPSARKHFLLTMLDALPTHLGSEDESMADPESMDYWKDFELPDFFKVTCTQQVLTSCQMF
jgi:hypothetical protein